MKISANKMQEEITDDKKEDTLSKALAPGPSLWKNQSLNFKPSKIELSIILTLKRLYYILQSYAKIQICQQSH